MRILNGAAIAAFDREDQALSKTLLGGATSPTPSDAAGLDPAARVKAVAARVLESLDDAKAEDVVSLDLLGKTSMADVMVVASGRSNTHVGAIADRLLKALKEIGVPPPRVQGVPHNDWILVDTGDVIVHLFRPEVRQFYNLEKLWGADRPAERRAV